jgi:oligoendopeptidase F
MVSLTPESTAPGDWDLSSYFPEFGGPALSDFKQQLIADLEQASRAAGALPALTEEADSQEAYSRLIHQVEALSKAISHLYSYIGCLSSADASNEAFQVEEGWLAEQMSALSKLRIPLLEGLKDAGADAFKLLIEREDLKDAAYPVSRMRTDGQKRMSAPEESLAAELGINGIHAWGRLYDRVSGNLKFRMKQRDGSEKMLSISQARSLMGNEDPEVRDSAFAGYTEAWTSVEQVCAAALNAIGGTRHSLYKERGIGHFLEPALFQAGCTRATLEALMEAVDLESDFPREILRYKARRMGKAALQWQDLESPIPLGLGDGRPISWQNGVEWTSQAYRNAFPELGAFFDHMIEHRWIDYSPRDNKRPGGFCTGSDITDEPRIYMTFNGDMGSVTTLAHEAGHAYHHHVMKGIRVMAREYPMTLAESASTFGESILIDGIVNDPDQPREVKLRLLEALVGSIPSYLINIPMRFHFEKAFYEARATAELSVSELKALMVRAQRECYRDVLAEGGEDPHFWASKLHFYISGISFYNFPYTFGFLLSRGLYNVFKDEGTRFLPKYKEFLRMTGSMPAEDVASRILGVNLSEPDFWQGAIRSLTPSFEEMKRLLGE